MKTAAPDAPQVAALLTDQCATNTAATDEALVDGIDQLCRSGQNLSATISVAPTPPRIRDIDLPLDVCAFYLSDVVNLTNTQHMTAVVGGPSHIVGPGESLSDLHMALATELEAQPDFMSIEGIEDPLPSFKTVPANTFDGAKAPP